MVLDLLECVLSSSSSGPRVPCWLPPFEGTRPIKTHRLHGLGNLQPHVTHQRLAKALLPRTAHGARGPKTLEHPPVHVLGPSVPGGGWFGGLAPARSGRQAWGPGRGARVSGWGGGWWRRGAGGGAVASPPRPPRDPPGRGRVHYKSVPRTVREFLHEFFCGFFYQ